MKPMPHDRNPPGEPPLDLAALLGEMPPEEADRLREVWMLAGHEEPTAFPAPEAVERAFERLMAGVAGAAGPVATGSPNGSPTGRLRGRADRRADRHTDRHARRAAAAWRPAWVGLAAVLVLGGLSLFWWSRPVTQAALPGERLAFTLPDGSRVELNSGARLRYARRFGDVRGVRLTGEAFFDVAAVERPFVVETFNARVRVLGTRFGVRAWPGGLDAGTTVALEAGRVSLAPAGRPAHAVALAPGETRRVVAGPAGVEIHVLPGVSVADATAWRRGDLVFKDQLLGVVLDDVARRFVVDIQVHPARLRHERISLALRQPADAAAVVRDLALALGLTYRETSNGFALTADVP